MTKKLSVVTLSLFVAALLTTSAFAANNCSGGTNPVFIGVGSSAQTNSLAYAAVNITTAGSFTGYEIWTTGGAKLQDTRFSTPPQDTGLTLWVVWVDNVSNPLVCDVYAYFQADSTIGVKDFFATAKSVSPGKGVYHATFGVPGSITGSGANKIPGLVDQVNVPSAIATLLTTSPAPLTATQPALPHCGQLGAIATTTVYCFFNMAGTDIRPEDALFATTRALSAYSTTNGLAGLGYNQVGSTGCNAVDTNQGCVITDSFGQSKAFNVLNFKISGTDPKSGATVPSSETLSTGISPVVVFVSNADTTNSLGLGTTYTDSKSKSHYRFTNINRKVLANIFDGTLSCTGVLLPGNPSSGNNVYDQGFQGGPPSGAGQPLQVVMREPLSGTYNTFEFGGVRTLTGSLAGTIKESAISATAWLSDDSSGQELDNNPSEGFLTAACSPTPNGSTNCGDPVWRATPSHPNRTNVSCPGSGQNVPFRARAIGTGEEVSATLGSFNSVTGALSPGWKVTDGIGYAFWSYQNFKTANATGSTPGHYLTVDSIDPLFITAGGEFDSQYGAATPNNPSGAFNLPQCPAISGGGSFPCQQIPFTHVYDGSYPIWSLLRQVTFKPVSGKQAVPAGVIAMNANAQVESINNSFNLSDFAPLLKNINTTTNTGDLNIGVFRSHYKQTNSPNNGNQACAGVFTGISIAASSGCLIDAGGDVGGSVLTIQSDDSFNKDFGSLFNSGKYEIYSLRQ